MGGGVAEVAKGLESGGHSELRSIFILQGTTFAGLLLIGEGLGDVVEGEVVGEGKEGDEVVVIRREGLDERHGR